MIEVWYGIINVAEAMKVYAANTLPFILIEDFEGNFYKPLK